MKWRFTIIDRNQTEYQIDDPKGWETINTKLKRDKRLQGIFFEYSLQAFEFFGLGAKLIQDEWERYGLQGEMYLLAEFDDRGHWAFFCKGKMVFAGYDGTYATDNSTKISIENTGETVEFVNAMDQKVDLMAAKAFDKVTDLPAYEFLGKSIDLPSKAIMLRTEGTNSTANKSPNFKDDPQWDTFSVILPGHQTVKSMDIPDSMLFDSYNLLKLDNEEARHSPDMTPTLEVKALSTIGCNGTEFHFECRYKGKIEWTRGSAGGMDEAGWLYLIKSPASNPTAYENIFVEPLWSTSGSAIAHFDVSKDLTLELELGDRLYYHIYRAGDFNRVASVYITEDPETFTKISTFSLCDPSPAQLFLVNEAGARIIESVTNRKMTLYSEFYGRTNSQPYAFGENGTGSQKAITSGLMVRRAKLADGSEPKLFMSVNDWFNNLRSIDNIGMGLEANGSGNGEFNNDFNDDFNHGYVTPFRIRVEDFRFFYQDEVILTLADVDKINTTCKADEHYATIKYGYEKWEAEEYNGLDEFLTKREARTALTQVKNALDIVCKWVASGYAFEITRRKGPDSKDWRFDNDTFITCLVPQGDSFAVEIGSIINDTNIFDPDTVYNYRISPIRNLMRWASTILASYKHANAASKIYFTSGEGNYIAAGELDSAFAKIEAGPSAEDGDLGLDAFADEDDGKPIMKLERDSFEYPLTMLEYQLLKRNPYKRIAYYNEQKSAKGWIDQIDYRPEDGKASFVLIPSIED